MSDAFEEVEENLRRDQYASWVRQYGLWALVALALVLAGVGGWQAYQSWSAKQAGEYAEKLLGGQKLFQAHDLLGAERYYTDLSKSAPGVYKGAALQMVAEALYEQGDMKNALVRLDEAANATPDKFLKNAAKLKAAYIAADLQDYKTVTPRLNELVEGGGSLGYQAREVLGAKAFEAGDLAKAREEYNFLSLALEAPEGVRQRARSALALMGPAPTAAGAAAKTPAK